jgi:excisionase family DNA binding protein
MQETIFTNMTKDDFRSFIQDAISEILADSQTATPPTPQPERLLNIEDVCSLLQISKPTLHNWKREGWLPFHRIGSKVYFREREVLEAIKTHQPRRR